MLLRDYVCAGLACLRLMNYSGDLKPSSMLSYGMVGIWKTSPLKDRACILLKGPTAFLGCRIARKKF